MEFEKKNGFYCKLLKTEEKKMSALVDDFRTL
jgi:hypothetical protein